MTNGEFPLSRNFYVPMRVNNMEAMYEVTCVNVKVASISFTHAQVTRHP